MPKPFFEIAVLLAAVTLLPPTRLSGDERLEVIDNENSILVQRNGVVVLAYHKKAPPAPAGVDPIYERSGILHPVNSPGGHSVTAIFPSDHLHQHGIFSAWVKTSYDQRTVDFWNLGAGQGRVLHERVVSIGAGPKAAGFEVELIHRITGQPAVDVLRERWKVTVHATDGTYHQFDLETTQSAITPRPLLVHEHHYGGLALRGPARWLAGNDADARRSAKAAREPSGFANNLGSDRIQGNHEHARWVSLWGQCDGQPVSVTVLCHVDNFRAPQAARLHPTKPYFCYAPCVDGQFVIDQDHPFQSRYRFLITDDMPNRPWLERQWRTWCGGAEATD